MIDNSTCIDFYLDWKSEFINLHMELFNVWDNDITIKSGDF